MVEGQGEDWQAYEIGLQPALNKARKAVVAQNSRRHSLPWSCKKQAIIANKGTFWNELRFGTVLGRSIWINGENLQG